MPIPARLHFLFIGTDLPWAYAFAPLSAAARGEIGEIHLHHTDPLADGPAIRAIRAVPGIRLAPLDPAACLARAGASLGVGDALAALHARLEGAVVRSDLLRAAILFVDGGIYLDLDTITVRSLRPLLVHPAFVGAERIVWPATARASRAPLVLARHLALDGLRKACRHGPRGWVLFRRCERLFPLSVSNAAMGTEPGSAPFADYLRAMLRLDPATGRRLYAIGPRLLDEVANRHGSDTLAVLPPPVFYPLPPEISAHWFRTVRRARAGDVLLPETRVVHWYGSILGKRALAAIDPVSVRARRARQRWSALVDANVPAIRAGDRRSAVLGRRGHR